MISYKYIKENILVPRNLERRKETLRQNNIKLLSQEIIEGDLEIDETFEGIDDELVKVKEIKGNVDLTIKKGYIPSWLKNIMIHGSFYCNSNNLNSLENCPLWIGETFSCSYNNLTSLKDGPEYVGFMYRCISNKLTSLEGCPKEIQASFNCCYNKLTSLEGGPEYVDDNFICSNNELTSLEGCPKYIGGDLKCHNNSKKLELPEDIELKGKLYN